jgi:glycogen phosphorylase
MNDPHLDLPEPLRRLETLAFDLAWSWWPDARALFSAIDPGQWRALHGNPVALLQSVPTTRLAELATDDAFVTQMNALCDRIEAEGNAANRTAMPNDGLVAYFCAEFGLTGALPIYSGGLGILAGDHVKSASELGLPFVGIGLFYRGGYFEQVLDQQGQQHANACALQPSTLPLRHARTPSGEPVHITVSIEGRDVHAMVWEVTVGRVRLFLLDTDVTTNSPEDRQITQRLYGGDNETRIRQEIVLGFGGVRALKALGLTPTVFHMNEGHAAFLTLERIRDAVAAGADFEAARAACAKRNVFTTHTPVAAGFDIFSAEQIDRVLPGLAESLGTTRTTLNSLAAHVGDDTGEHGFNMAYLAIRCADWRNGVSQLHAKVSRGMWREMWPGTAEDDIPIIGVTNGVHTRTWVSQTLGRRLGALSGRAWEGESGSPELWAAAMKLSSAELWGARCGARAELIQSVRTRHVASLRRRGASADALSHAELSLDPDALTIGFARRFATYKRATLILRDRDRLHRLLDDSERPVQMLFAGKAHPRDVPGQAFLRELYAASQEPRFRGRIVVLEGYDIPLGRELVQGVDVWLNTPRCPKEASGTSGMKVAANGGLNLSILDGWWAEGYDGTNGWAIGNGEVWDDHEAGDARDAVTLLDLLEREVIPTFYDRTSDGHPEAWLACMRRAMLTSGPVYATDRMVRDYAELLYAPAHAAGG